ncbi:MAG: methylenetetrahydrofolate reductase [NAD(P)H] [Bacillota bacterium]|nr:methylenetetrahydrofolate reductase [NAD(P)H] [Bacillota bacterium]
MKISQIYSQKKCTLSFEIFPPKGDLDILVIKSVLSELSTLCPDFISVTYSAGGSGKSNNTEAVASIIKDKYNINSIAHLTCANSSYEEITNTIKKFKEHGIENVLALRGDLIQGARTTDFSHAKDLIPLLKNEDICVGAACYPEGHVNCDSIEEDIMHLKEKQDAGADFFISQLFFDNSYFYKFLDKAISIGITKPVSPGVMPILSKSQISKMIFMCGASLPSEIIRLLNKYENDEVSLRKAGIEYAAKQIGDLMNNNVSGIHIYTMNQSDIAKSILSLLG